MKLNLKLIFTIVISAVWYNIAYPSIKTNYYDHSVNLTVGRSVILNPVCPIGFTYDGFGFTTPVGINQVNPILISPGVLKVEGIQKIEGVCSIYISFTKRSGIGNNDITQNLHRYSISVVNLENVTIPNSLSLFIGDTSTITPSLTPSQASTSYRWHSSDTSVATVSDSGTVTALSSGKTKITCTTHNGKSSECEVTVKPILMQSLSINPSEIIIDKNESILLEALIQPTNTTNKNLDWTSSDESKVIVSPNGKILAINSGKVFISAKSKDGSNLSADVVVTVKGTNVQSIILNQQELTLLEGETFRINTTVLPLDADNKTLTWSSSSEVIASVSQDGLITAHSPGCAYITATTTDGSNVTSTCIVTVIPVSASSITLDKTDVTLKIGEYIKLNASIFPEAVRDKDISWTSSNEYVATVNDGIVTAVSAGTATITASCDEAKTNCIVTVKPILIEQINLNETDVSIAAGETLQLYATVSPDNASNKKVVWTSDNEDIATVIEGVVTAKKYGDCNIICSSADGSNISAICHISVRRPEQLWLSVIIPNGNFAINVTGLENIPVKITPDKGYIINSITLDGIEYQHSGGEILLPKLNQNTMLNIVFAEDPNSGMKSLTGNSESLKVKVANNVVSIYGLSDGQNVYIYDINGRLLDVTNEDTFVLSESGIYLLQIDGKIFKLAIR